MIPLIVPLKNVLCNRPNVLQKGMVMVKFNIFPVLGVTHGFESCPTNEFKVWGEFCYYFHKTRGTRITFENAERDCEGKGGDAKLASIHSNDENEYIFANLNAGTRLDWWIGMKKDGKGLLMFSNWSVIRAWLKDLKVLNSLMHISRDGCICLLTPW